MAMILNNFLSAKYHRMNERFVKIRRKGCFRKD